MGNQQKQQQKPPHWTGLRSNCATLQNYSCVYPREGNIVTDSRKHNVSKAAIPGKTSPTPHRFPCSRRRFCCCYFSRHPGTFQRFPCCSSPSGQLGPPQPADREVLPARRSRRRCRGAGPAGLPRRGSPRTRSPAGTRRFAPPQRLKHRESE